MHDLLDEIDAALGHHLYQLALAGALAVPDIAGALASPTGKSTPSLYVDWFDKHVGPHLVTHNGPISGATFYRFRCSMLHQGSVEDQKAPLQFRRLVFVDPRAPGVFHLNIMGDALNLDVLVFCSTVTSAARAWLKSARGQLPFEANLQRCVRYRPEGLLPHFVGIPVIG